MSSSGMSDPNDHLILTQSQINVIVALSVCTAFALFVSGYYVGKWSADRWVSANFVQESFADKIYSSMCALTDTAPEGANEEPVDAAGAEVEEPVMQPVSQEPMEYAELAGFGTKVAAEACATKFKNRGIPVEVVQRTSTNRSGKPRNWYQVVTEPMPHSELAAAVEVLVRTEHLRGYTIKQITSQ